MRTNRLLGGVVIGYVGKHFQPDRLLGLSLVMIGLLFLEEVSIPLILTITLPPGPAIIG